MTGYNFCVQQKPWRIWTDTGGTFTDCLALDPRGVLHRAKVLSSSAIRGHVRARIAPNTLTVELPYELPDGFFEGAVLRLLDSGGSTQIRRSRDRGQVLELERPLLEAKAGAYCEIRTDLEAPILGAHLLTETPIGRKLPPMSLRIATTRGTNALLERKGAPTALFITHGFGDLLVIGHQQRPKLFDLVARAPAPLYSKVVEVEERLASDGTVIRKLDVEAVRYAALDLVGHGISSAAIALLNSYANPEHEHLIAEILRSAGFNHVSCSADLAPLIKLLPRAQTAVVDAYLSPILGEYLNHVVRHKGDGTLHVMTSAGGLVRDYDFSAKDALLSGPAGGVVGAAETARSSGVSNLIAFDMGGTSTDVSRWCGEYEYVFEHQVGDAHLVAPALAIETVAAGGGSVCYFDGHQLKVGPQSAGADPGPASYGAGGPLAVTDVNLLLGRIVPERFGIPVVPDAARDRLDEILTSVAKATGEEIEPTAALQGFLQIANERMASAVRAISVQRGHDPSQATLIAFGGAGPQHACAVAELLNVKQVLVPPDASLLSAWGLGRGVVERFEQRQILKPLAQCSSDLESWIEDLGHSASRAVAAEGIDVETVEVRRSLVNLRLEGQETALTIEWSAAENLEGAFIESYQAVYGYPPPERAIEVESIRAVASTKRAQPSKPLHSSRSEIPMSVGFHSVFSGGRWHKAQLYERDAIPAGGQIDGPALILEPHATTVVEPDWRVEVDTRGSLILKRITTTEVPSSSPDSDLIGERP
jgi:5-oxoprolinase (ATP-hydrolysing)